MSLEKEIDEILKDCKETKKEKTIEEYINDIETAIVVPRNMPLHEYSEAIYKLIEDWRKKKEYIKQLELEIKKSL